MVNWRSSLISDPLDWLLEPENPSIRFWALTDLLDRPANDADVLQARQAIHQQPLVKELFALQHPDGHWGDDPTTPYSAQGAVGVLSLLHMLGVQPDERTALGCNSLIRYSQHISGGFSLTKARRSGIFPCTTGEHLPFLIYFGLGSDPRVQAAFAFLIAAMSADRPLKCSRYQEGDCLWGAIAALNGLSVLPTSLRTSETQQIVNRLADMLLNAGYDFEGEHRRWLTFGVPRGWDLLSALRALTLNGFGRDERLGPLLKLILMRQDQQGRFMCGSVSRTWPLEKRGQPSKWVTLDVLAGFKRDRNWRIIIIRLILPKSVLC